MASRTASVAACMATGNANADTEQGLPMPPVIAKNGPQGTSNWECSRYDEQFYKTKLCSLWKNGSCRRRRCRFAHGEHELQHSPDLSKTAMCKGLQRNGHCSDASCKFAHDLSELRATEKFFKTTLCSFSQDGKCKMGEQCRHAHSRAELRSMDPTLDTLPPEEWCGDMMGCQNIAWKRLTTTPASFLRPSTITEEGAMWRRSVTSPTPREIDRRAKPPQGHGDGKLRSPMRLSELITEAVDSDFGDDDDFDDFESVGSPWNHMVSAPGFGAGAQPGELGCNFVAQAGHQLPSPAQHRAQASPEVGQQILNYQMWVQSVSQSAPMSSAPKHQSLTSYQARPKQQSMTSYQAQAEAPRTQPLERQAPQGDGPAVLLGQVPWGRNASVPASMPQGGSCHIAVMPMPAQPQVLQGFGGDVTWGRSASVPAAPLGNTTSMAAGSGWPQQAFAQDGAARFAFVPVGFGVGCGQPQPPMHAGGQQGAMGLPMHGAAPSAEQALPTALQALQPRPVPQQPQAAQLCEAQQPMPQQQGLPCTTDPAGQTDFSAVSPGLRAFMTMMQPARRSDEADSLIRDLQVKILEAAMPEVYED